ncbi:hypothetical protein [Allobranchiibius sp. GilTou73]|uniref:hypothetical protein n=1 Tax=Allobranchiibius sp. GilTou73 TaxID=2904523 RepID=UPI001F2D5570|nr:hypothetical protein [Allobranchiibius sp. GilTou73]UIJ33509.1 hypothetical protein LVQ62_09995 [Allobranchiibius sp. GilTou73]
MIALAGCSTRAPGVVVPPSRSATSSSQPIPTVSEGGVAGPAGTVTCPFDADLSAVLNPKAQVVSFGKTVSVLTAYPAAKVQITVGTPRIVSSQSENPPPDGMQYVAFPTLTHLVSGASYGQSDDNFALYDPHRISCQQASAFDDVLPAGQLLASTATVSTAHRDARGSVIYETPSGADLTSYTLTFADDSDELAKAEWTR